MTLCITTYIKILTDLGGKLSTDVQDRQKNLLFIDEC